MAATAEFLSAASFSGCGTMTLNPVDHLYFSVAPNMNNFRFHLFVVMALFVAVSSAFAQKPIGGPTPPADSQPDQRNRTGEPKDIQALSDEIKELKTQIDVLRRQNWAVVNHLIYAPGFEAREEDYAQARSQFQTRLIRKGPSPQEQPMPAPPEGVSVVEYTSGNLHLKGWINRPSDEARKHPAVLYLHGGFALGAGDWEQSKAYREAGFVVMTPMFRGENGQPGSFSYFYDEVDDVRAAAEYLTKQSYIDSKRVFLAGHSIGGTMTLLASMASKHFRAAASFDGFPYWAVFADDWALPFDKSDPREINLRSPLPYTSSLKCPLRLYYHDAERDLLGDYLTFMNRRMVAMAKNRGLDVDAVAVAGDHMTHVAAAMRQSIGFFQRLSSQEISEWKGTVSPLPKTLEIDLGGGIPMKLVRIEPGKLRMGSPSNEAGRKEDETLHEAAIARSFTIGVFPVTQAQFRQVMGTRPSTYVDKGDEKQFLREMGTKKTVLEMNTDDFPVDHVSWEDAIDFSHIVSLLPEVREKGWVVDLPTEAEWEYACRAGTEAAFHYGSTLSSTQANFNGDGPYGGAAKGPDLGRPSKVGSYAPNAWGLYDMHGNVLQWCKDIYDANYLSPEMPTSADHRVARGGFFRLPAGECRAARRFHFHPTLRAVESQMTSPIGFRVVVRQRGR
jgi:formylglycine-generating enzyme required for sulfatase activity